METETKNEKKEKAIPISQMMVGSLYLGREIEEIPARGSDFIVYRFAGSTEILYRYTDPKFSGPIARLEALVHGARRKFKGENASHFAALEATIVRRVFNGCSDEDLDKLLAHLKAEIDSFPEIERMIGRGPNYAVWQLKNGELGFRHKKTTPEIERAIAEFVRIQTMSADLLPSGAQSRFNLRLGATLHVAFKLNSESKEAFADLEKLVIQTMQGEVKIKLLVITVAVAIVLMFFAIAAYYLFSLPQFVKFSAISATGGFAGALISFLERSKTSRIGDGELGRYVILSNVCRVLIGGIFGVIAFAAANADLAFSVFKSTKPALLILGVAAGFSERLIPDVLGSIAASKTPENSAKEDGK